MHDRPGFFRFLDTRRNKEPVRLRFARCGLRRPADPDLRSSQRPRLFLTPRSRRKQYFSEATRRKSVDAIFIAGVIVLYALTHWLAQALSRLGEVE